MQGTQSRPVRLQIQRASVDPLNRIDGVHDVQDSQFVRGLRQRDTTADASLKMHDILLFQPLQHFRKIGRGNLSHLGDRRRRLRFRSPHRQMHDSSKCVFNSL